MWKPLLKAHNKLESVKLYGKFSIFGKQILISSRRTHFDMRHHMHLRENLPMRVSKSPPQFSMPCVKVGSTKALNRWNLSPQHVTLINTPFL